MLTYADVCAQVACRPHGIYFCSMCGLDVASPAVSAGERGGVSRSGGGGVRSQHAQQQHVQQQHPHSPMDGWTSVSSDYTRASTCNPHASNYSSSSSSSRAYGAGSGSSTCGAGRLRLDKAAAARFVAHGIGYSGPMPKASGTMHAPASGARALASEAAAQSSWSRAMSLSKGAARDRRLESGGLHAPGPQCTSFTSTKVPILTQISPARKRGAASQGERRPTVCGRAGSVEHVC